MTRAIVAVLALMLVAPAAAQGKLRLVGSELRPRHSQWVAQVQERMPLADARITFYAESCDGSACYEPFNRGLIGNLYLPKPRQIGYHNERFLFAHELGHAFYYRHTDRSERSRFKRAIGRTRFPTTEVFAEMYAFCALDLFGTDLAGYFVYGWYPKPGTEATLCALIRSFA